MGGGGWVTRAHREHERAHGLHTGELKVEAPQPLVLHQEAVAVGSASVLGESHCVGCTTVGGIHSRFGQLVHRPRGVVGPQVHNADIVLVACVEGKGGGKQPGQLCDHHG